MGLFKKVAPHRRAGDYDALGVLIERAALLKAHHDAACVLFQHLGGEAGDHVGLVHRRGDAPQGGVLHHGVAGIAAGAHHQIRRKLPQDLVGSAPQDQEVCGAFQVVSQAVEA